MTATTFPTATAVPFGSVAELRRSHAALLKVARDPGRAAELRDDLPTFLARAQATGTRLDAPADREAVQGILDYWAASLFTQSAGLAVAPEAQRPSPANLLLAEFDAPAARTVAASADQMLAALGPADRELARRLLLRLVHLAPEGRSFAPTPAPRAALEALGDAARVRYVLDRLTEAEVIRGLPEGQTEPEWFALRDDALTRTWGQLSFWLEQRTRFRDAVCYWQQNHRARAALISGDLLDEARGYHDLNATELQFLDASRHDEIRHSRRLKGWIVALAVLASIAVVGWIVAAAMNIQVRGQRDQVAQKERDVENANQQLQKEKDVTALKQRITNMALLARTLTEIGTARNAAEQDIATRRWNYVSKTLQQEGYFKEFLGNQQADLDDILKNAASPEGKEMIFDKVLALGKQLKAEANNQSDPEVNALLTAMRALDYATVQWCAEKIVETLETSPYTHANSYLKEFWTLYWGELVLLEKQDVETAMVNFGNLLKEIDEDVDAPAAGERPPNPNLKKKPANQPYWQREKNAPKKADPKKVKALEKLRVELDAALNRELAQPIAAGN